MQSLREETPKTQDASVLEIVPDEKMTAREVDAVGAKVCLYREREKEKYVYCFITPNNYSLSRQTMLELCELAEDPVWIVGSKPQRDKSIDELNVSLLDKLMPPNPLRTVDHQNNKPRVIEHVFDFKERILLVEIIRGLKS